MKRLLSFVLVLAMASALVSAAFAFEDMDPPLWKRFSYDSLEECVEDCFGGSLEAYYEKAEYQSIREKWDKFLKENPDYIDGFNEELWWQGYSDAFASRAEAIEFYRLDSDAELTDKLRQEWLDSRFEMFRTIILNQKKVAELGGKPGEINVMLNGEFIDFADSYPTTTAEGRVVVPFRAMLEALGAKVDYDSETNQAKAVYGDKELVHTVGTDTITLTEGEESREITMDCRSYISEDFSTLLPVRSIAETLGYCVGWSTEYQTVIIIDPAVFEEEYAGKFDVLNMLLLDSESRFDPETSYSQSGSLSLRLSELEDGGEDYSITGEIGQLFKDDKSNSSISLDLSEVIEYLSSKGEFLPGGDLGVSFEELKKLDMELIVDSESGVYYIKSPVMGDPDTWLVGSFYENALGRSFLSRTEPVVDGVISAFAAAGLDIYSYEDIGVYLENLSATLGDDCFARSGNTYKLSAKSKALKSLFGIEEDKGLFMELTITDLGEGLCDFSLIFGRRDEGVLTALSMGRGGSKWSLRLEASADGLSRFTLSMDTVTSESGDEPASTPPEEDPDTESALPDETDLSGILEFITVIE